VKLGFWDSLGGRPLFTLFPLLSGGAGGGGPPGNRVVFFAWPGDWGGGGFLIQLRGAREFLALGCVRFWFLTWRNWLGIGLGDGLGREKPPGLGVSGDLWCFTVAGGACDFQGISWMGWLGGMDRVGFEGEGRVGVGLLFGAGRWSGFVGTVWVERGRCLPLNLFRGRSPVMELGGDVES